MKHPNSYKLLNYHTLTNNEVTYHFINKLYSIDTKSADQQILLNIIMSTL